MYRLQIHFLFSWPWPCLSIFPPSIPEPVQWKKLTLLYQNHELKSHIYTGLLEVRMGICSKKYWCIDGNLNLSYTPPPLKKFQTNSLMDPNQIHLKENILTFTDLFVVRRVRDDPTSWSFHCHWDDHLLWCLKYQLPMWIGRVIAYLNPKLSALVWVYQQFFILFPNHKPCPNSSITTYPESSVKSVTLVNIGTLICSA